MSSRNSDASDAFEQLGEKDQKAAINVAIGTILIGMQISSAGQQLYDWLATEFASSNGLPSNVVKYALRKLGQRLYKEDWTFYVEKSGDQITAHFTPIGESEDEPKNP
jgi:hypothetical protein